MFILLLFFLPIIACMSDHLKMSKIIRNVIFVTPEIWISRGLDHHVCFVLFCFPQTMILQAK